MVLPALQEISTSRERIASFGGYNHNDVNRENEFYDMKNMTASRFPVLSPRNKRGIVRTFTKSNGMAAKNCLYWVDGTGFYGNDGTDGATVLRGSVSDSPKMFASMGAYLLIWPDKKAYNTSTKVFSDLEKTWKAASGAPITYSLAKWSPQTLGTTDFTDSINAGSAAPATPTDNTYWYDTASTPNVLKQWSASSKTWASVPTTYVRIAAAGIGTGFSRYDGLTISGSTNAAFNNTFVVMDVGENHLTVKGLIPSTFTQQGGLTVSRTVPDMDFITELDNRLWGCSSAKHEIYACKLGDPFNWHCFEGLSTDSYAAATGSDGDFTGACSYMGYVLFFKENIVHRIYGSKPANFQLTSNLMRGVEKGSEKSLAIVNETLYYKSRNGIVAYEGGAPVTVSDALGSVHYTDAAAGAIGDTYYVSMKDAANTWHVFVYDEVRGVWHREDNLHVKQFVTLGGTLYFIGADDNKLYTATGTNEAAFDWFAETGTITGSSPDHKTISKLILRMELEAGSTMTVDMQFDGGEWTRMASLSASALRSFPIHIIPHRCDHFRMRFAGNGGARIFSLCKEIEQGSEL